MTRRDTRSLPQAVSIKSIPKKASVCRFISFIAIGVCITLVYLYITEPIDSLGDPSKDLVVRSIPQEITKLEGIDPDERELFQGFRTSFLPAEDLVIARKHSNQKRELYEGNETSDIFIWSGSNQKNTIPTRVKRKSHFTFASQDDDQENESPNKYRRSSGEKDEVSQNESEVEEVYEDNYDENLDEIEHSTKAVESSVIHPEPRLDRGPLDDVIEQVRGQPELEEGEMGSSAHLYRSARKYIGIHSFWKDQDDKNTIRKTQANIMKQFMDPDADPCHDFYQYACGNWAALNPIPPDKAGYDTFEMLRENLDTVLKELLEIKEQTMRDDYYPGPRLDLEDNFLTLNAFLNNIENHSNSLIRFDKSDIIKRIRRYLDRKSKQFAQPMSKFRYDVHKIQNLFGNGKKYDTKSPRVRRNNGEIIKNSISRKFSFRSDNKILGRKFHMFKRIKRLIKEPEPVVVDKITQTIEKSQEVSKGDAALKAKFLYKSCMNYKILKKRGHQPLLDLLSLLGGWPILDPSWSNSTFDWLELMAKLRLYNNDILISEWVGPDIKNSDEFVIQFDQTSLGLPTRDYFLQDSNKVYLDAYKTYLITVAILLGGEPKYVKMCADELINFEIKLASITSAPEDRRNVSELYQRMPLHKLEELVPEVKWRRYLCVVMNRSVKPDETVVLFALNFVRNLVKLIEQTESRVLANYLLWRFVRHRVNNLDDRFQSVKQEFYFTLFGREQSPPRWKNCISQVNSNMGMALGSMFVRKYFDETSKNDTLTMTREIQWSFKELLQSIDWIDAGTKKLAAHKVDAMMLRIGYPGFILNKKELDERYQEVKIHPAKYFENILNILQHLTKMEQSRIGQPVNKTLWNTAPAVVNAYYSRNKNQIMFPAGILQPPFYHRHFPRSLNYGGIGVVIGHEITHGFDDKGRLFDCDGNLHRWWTDSAIDAFHERAQCLIDQYGQYIVPEVNVNLDGVNTQGENIADNGGVKQAFRAYTQWLKKHDATSETLPGLNHTHKQLFFLNFAQVWCGAMRPEAMRNKLKTAVHSPGRFRVIGTLSNSEDFAREFQCPAGTPMNPIKKCAVW